MKLGEVSLAASGPDAPYVSVRRPSTSIKKLRWVYLVKQRTHRLILVNAGNGFGYKLRNTEDSDFLVFV